MMGLRIGDCGVGFADFGVGALRLSVWPVAKLSLDGLRRSCENLEILHNTAQIRLGASNFTIGKWHECMGINRFLWMAAAGMFLNSQSGALETNTSVFPQGFENSGGNSFNANLFRVPTTYQQIVLGSTLEGQWETPVLIDSIAFRVKGSSPFNLQTTIPKVEIQLSTTLRTAGSTSMNWDNNRGSEVKTVYLQENVNISATGTLVLNPFDLKFQFSETFYYDPKLGNLAMQITTFGPSAFEGGGGVDAQSYGGPNASSKVASFTSSELFVRGTGLVAEYTFTSVPEPRSLLMLLVAAGLFLAPKIACFKK